MMRWVRSCVVGVAAMLGCAQGAFAGTQIPNVVVSVAPLKPYADEILAGITTAQSLTRAGQDPHVFTLSPTQAKMLDEAEIIIIPDRGMSSLLARLIAKHPKLKVIELSTLPGADTLPYMAENPWVAQVKKAGGVKDDDAEKSPEPLPSKGLLAATHHEPAAPNGPIPSVDPHFWLDPERMAALAKPVANAIAEFAPDQRNVMLHNADNLAQHLRRDVLPPLKTLLQAPARDDITLTKPEIPFITYHAAYQYFLARFGLTNAGDITARPDDYLGARSLDQLLSAAKTVRIHCIISETDTTLVRRIAVLAQARVVVLSPEQLVRAQDVSPLDWIRNDYDRLLYTTAKRFAECL